MCSSCMTHEAVARGLCKSCYNKAYWSRATPDKLAKRRVSVSDNYYSKRAGTFTRKKLVNPTPQQKREIQNANTRLRRSFLKHLLDDIKIQLGCIDCGYRDAAIALDFDHVSEKSFGISRAVNATVSLDRVLTEIEKCEVRCANCHRVVTQQRRDRELE